MGVVLPVSAFARISTTIDIRPIQEACKTAFDSLKEWWELAPANTHAHIFFSPDNRQFYYEYRHRLRNACDTFDNWENVNHFFTTPDGQHFQNQDGTDPSLAPAAAFATAHPTADNANHLDRQRRNPGIVVAGLIGGAFLLAHVVSLLFGGAAPSFELVAATHASANSAAINANALQQLTSTVSDVYHYDHFMTTLNGIRDNADALSTLAYRFQTGIFDLHRGHISPMFITAPELARALTALDAKANKHRMHAAVNTVADALLLPAFGVTQPGQLTVILPVPVVSDKMYLHRFAGTPLITRSEGKHTRNLVSPQPHHTAIAIAARSSNHVLLNAPDLDACFQVKRTYMCPDMPIRHMRTESCLGALFTANSKAIQKQCTFAPHPEDWHVARIATGKYVLSSLRDTSATTACPGGESYSTHVPWGVYILEVPPGCTTQTPHFSITTALDTFAQVKIHKQLSWDMDVPLSWNYSSPDFRTIANHAAAAADQAHRAQEELANLSHHPYTPYVAWPTATIIALIVAYCLYRRCRDRRRPNTAAAAPAPAAAANSNSLMGLAAPKYDAKTGLVSY